ncbi:hypothetical protein D7V86_19125 [bacterium D16-51]|nr:hypothetical protein D7V96_06260 [bacterium D16-59]RKI56702.1 hypothetical protein D7V86_19125 [bacterium D16-51]
MIRFELNRCLRGKGIKLAVLLAVLLAAGEFFGYRILFQETKEIADEIRRQQGFSPSGLYPSSLYEGFINGDAFTIFNLLYYYLFPILAVLPFGCSFFTDENSGYLKYIYSQKKKENYLLAKYTAVFLSGAVAGILPAIFSFLANALYLPAIIPNTLALQSHTNDSSVMADFYYTCPWAYFLVYLLLGMLAGGFLATLALSASFFARNALLVLFSPMIFYTALDYALAELGHSEFSISTIINPVGTHYIERITLGGMFLEISAFAAAAFLVFFFIGKKRERIL